MSAGFPNLFLITGPGSPSVLSKLAVSIEQHDGAVGRLDYRLYRPATDGPHPLACYFHGDGWVLGAHVGDDPFCRDLCVRSDATIVSVDYRHAPEARFPAAVDDAWAALQWVVENAVELGGEPGKLVVAGFSAGANLAAVAVQRARDAGGPRSRVNSSSRRSRPARRPARR